MESKTKGLIINSVFTFVILALFLPIILESRVYFNKNSKAIFLGSEFTNYKTRSFEVKRGTLNANNNGDSLLNQNNIVRKIEVVQNPYEIESTNSIQLPLKMAEDIYNNPLLSGFYIQLGILKTKDEAQKIINDLTEKSLITEDYSTYIEAKSIQGRKFYIPQIGVFNTKNDAVNFCTNLQKLQINCLIID